MHYISTRGEAPELAFDDCCSRGSPPTAGSMSRRRIPASRAKTSPNLPGCPTRRLRLGLSNPSPESLGGEVLRDATRAAYAGFSHAAVAPLAQIADNLFVLELFHGPTLAFKDLAMQLLGRLMNHVLERRDLRVTIVGATSGDTGSAAIEAFRGQSRVDMFILYPHGRVSNVQRRQMTTVADDNVHAMALDGTFDDAQAILKGMFRDTRLSQRLGLRG